MLLIILGNLLLVLVFGLSFSTSKLNFRGFKLIKRIFSRLRHIDRNTNWNILLFFEPLIFIVHKYIIYDAPNKSISNNISDYEQKMFKFINAIQKLCVCPFDIDNLMINNFVRIVIKFVGKSFAPKLMGRFLVIQAAEAAERQKNLHKVKAKSPKFRQRNHQIAYLGIRKPKPQQQQDGYSQVHSIHIDHDTTEKFTDIETVVSQDFDFDHGQIFWDEVSMTDDRIEFIELDSSYGENL